MNDLQGTEASLHNWATMTEEELRAYATQFVGWSTNEMSDPEDLKWTLERVDLDRFCNLQTNWQDYFRDEVQDRYDDRFINDEFHSPIVLSFEMDDVILWDGYHRIAAAMNRQDQTILAITGCDQKKNEAKP